MCLKNTASVPLEGRYNFIYFLNSFPFETSHFSLSTRSLYIYTKFLKPNCSFELPYKDLKNADILPATRSWGKKYRYS